MKKYHISIIQKIPFKYNSATNKMFQIDEMNQFGAFDADDEVYNGEFVFDPKKSAEKFTLRPIKTNGEILKRVSEEACGLEHNDCAVWVKSYKEEEQGNWEYNEREDMYREIIPCESCPCGYNRYDYYKQNDFVKNKNNKDITNEIDQLIPLFDLFHVELDFLKLPNQQKGKTQYKCPNTGLYKLEYDNGDTFYYETQISTKLISTIRASLKIRYRMEKFRCWKYAGVCIPFSLFKIRHRDQANYVSLRLFNDKTGEHSEFYTKRGTRNRELSDEEYREKYAIPVNDEWWYKSKYTEKYLQRLKEFEKGKVDDKTKYDFL